MSLDGRRSSSWRHALLDLGEFVVELAKAVLISLVIILPVRYYVVQPFYVKGASMEPSFFDHEYLLIDELSYRFTAPARGDVVVFRYPRDPRQFFIKRVVGLPGETVRLGAGRVTVVNEAAPNGFVLDEPYLAPGTVTVGEGSWQVPAGHYFILGDNRAASLDSRVFGFLPASHITGRVWLRAWPLDRWERFRYVDALLVSPRTTLAPAATL
jgi:signal peptidase I